MPIFVTIRSHFVIPASVFSSTKWPWTIFGGKQAISSPVLYIHEKLLGLDLPSTLCWIVSSQPQQVQHPTKEPTGAPPREATPMAMYS